MSTSYTSLLGLALPATGEEPGTWGTLVNSSITNLLDSAVAGATTFTLDNDKVLEPKTGTADDARQAILLWTAGGTATRYISAPSQSKVYVVINKTSSTQSIVLRGFSGTFPSYSYTTGVTVVAGEYAVCAWNGVDFIKTNAPTAKSLTFATTGGDSSGITFNGSVAHTISPETIGALSTSGGNIGGTLGILSGNPIDLFNPSNSGFGSISQDSSNRTAFSNQIYAPNAVVDGWVKIGGSSGAPITYTAGSAPGYVARAFAQFTVSGGIITLVTSYNISSAVYLGTGSYYFQLATPSPTTDMAVIGASRNFGILFATFWDTGTAGRARIFSCQVSSGNLYDSDGSIACYF